VYKRGTHFSLAKKFSHVKKAKCHKAKCQSHLTALTINIQQQIEGLYPSHTHHNIAVSAVLHETVSQLTILKLALKFN